MPEIDVMKRFPPGTAVTLDHSRLREDYRAQPYRNVHFENLTKPSKGRAIKKHDAYDDLILVAWEGWNEGHSQHRGTGVALGNNYYGKCAYYVPACALRKGEVSREYEELFI